MFVTLKTNFWPSWAFKQQKTFSVFAQPDINTRGVGRIRDSYANPRRSRGFCITVENSPNPSSVYIRLCKHRKKFSIAFIKYFPKLIRQLKGILFVDFLIQKEFLNTRSRQSSFLLTNQNAHLITHEPMKFRVTKVKSNLCKSPASKRASCK